MSFLVEALPLSRIILGDRWTVEPNRPMTDWALIELKPHEPGHANY